MRYQAKGMKVLDLTNVRNALTARRAVMKAIINPMASIVYSLVVNVNPFFIRSNPVAAIIVGIAKRNENSTLVSRLTPVIIAPKMDAALRETPGIMERDWKSPMKNDCLRVIVSNVCVLNCFCLKCFSRIRNAIPPIPSAHTVIKALPSKNPFTTL